MLWCQVTKCSPHWRCWNWAPSLWGKIFTQITQNSFIQVICLSSSIYLFIQSFTFISMDLLIFIQMVGFNLILYYLIYCTNDFIFGHGSSFGLIVLVFLWHILIISFFKHFLTSCHYKIFWAYSVCFLPQPQNQIFLQGTWFILVENYIKNQVLGVRYFYIFDFGLKFVRKVLTSQLSGWLALESTTPNEYEYQHIHVHMYFYQ